MFQNGTLGMRPYRVMQQPIEVEVSQGLFDGSSECLEKAGFFTRIISCMPRTSTYASKCVKSDIGIITPTDLLSSIMVGESTKSTGKIRFLPFSHAWFGNKVSSKIPGNCYSMCFVLAVQLGINRWDIYYVFVYPVAIFNLLIKKYWRGSLKNGSVFSLVYRRWRMVRHLFCISKGR